MNLKYFDNMYLRKNSLIFPYNFRIFAKIFTKMKKIQMVDLQSQYQKK